MNKLIFKTPELAAVHAAKTVDRLLRGKPDSVLCLAAGHTSLPIFDAIIRMGTDFSKARFIGLDEWVGVSPQTEGSCAYFVEQNFFSRIAVCRENIRMFDAMARPADACAAMERQLTAWGGIDYLLLGMGMNGHLALNEPGESFASGVHEAPLSSTTKQVAPKYFPAGMPPITSGVTLGIRNIIEARHIQLAVFGAHKAPAVAALLQTKADESLPATVLHNAAHAELLLDEAAAGAVS